MPSSEHKLDQASRSSGRKGTKPHQDKDTSNSVLNKAKARDTHSPALVKAQTIDTSSPSSSKVQNDADSSVDKVQDNNNPPRSGKGPKRSLTLTTRCSSTSRSSQVSTTPSLAGSGKSSHHDESTGKEDPIEKLSQQEEANFTNEEGTDEGDNEQEGLDRRSRGRCRSALPHSAVLVVKILKWRYSDDDVAKTAFERTEQWIKNHAGNDVPNTRTPSPLDDHHFISRPRSQSLSKIRTGERKNKNQQQIGERDGPLQRGKGMFGKPQEAKEKGSKGTGKGYATWKKEKSHGLARKKSLI